MCLEHASAIDNAGNVTSYPPEHLSEWKRLQVDEYRRLMSGWPLTEAMAEEAIALSISGSDIHINDSTIQLGGEGGRAPGAGGGGGGAIGHGARAGRGGDGGPIRMENELPRDFVSKIAELDLGYAPGAGGGGAGAIGDYAVAGDGGNGGEAVTGTFIVEPGDVIEADVGEGGRGGSLPGHLGESGRDTVLWIRAADGTLKHEIRAAGGAASASGRLPDDVVEISEADLDGGFRIPVLLLANSVDMRDGLLFVLAGGWETFTVPQLPFEAIWPVILKAAWQEIDSSVTRGLQLCVLDPQGTEMSRITILVPPECVRSDKTFTWVGPIGAPLHSNGTWTIRIRSGERILSQIGVRVL